MQDTYEFDVNSAVTKGTIEYFDHENNFNVLEAGQKLDKNGLLDLAKRAKEKNLYDKSIIYMNEGLR